MAAQPRGNDQTRTLLLIAAVVGVIAVLGVVVALVVGGGDDGGDDGGGVDMYRPVTSTARRWPQFTAEIRRSGRSTIRRSGSAVPVVSGVDYDGNEITIDPATDGPTMVVLLAHWCPHCNDEIPVLNEWRDSGEIPEDLNIVGVSTGVSSDAPNYPPDEWLVEMDWQWPVLADDSPRRRLAASGDGCLRRNVISDDGAHRRRRSGPPAPFRGGADRRPGATRRRPRRRPLAG